MNIEVFKLERMQSTWENVVEYNLAESGVRALNLEEILGPEELSRVLALRLGYSQTIGTPALREAIAVFYPGINPETGIMAASGSTEANYLCIWALIEPGDEIVFEMPNYMQMHGLGRNFGARIKTFWLRPDRDWAPDLDELAEAVTERTKYILLTNPNNPTGAVLTEAEMDAIVRVAERFGTTLLVDEVYQGAERIGGRTPSFWGRYDKVICVNGLSKAYGLPGLRIGWVAAPPSIIERLQPAHDYTTMSPSVLSDAIAAIALRPPLRDKILARTRAILERNWTILDTWLRQRGVFTYVPPKAGAIVFTRYALDVNSTALALDLIKKRSVFIAPGDLFEIDRHLRIGFGSEERVLRTALERITPDFKAWARPGPESPSRSWNGPEDPKAAGAPDVHREST